MLDNKQISRVVQIIGRAVHDIPDPSVTLVGKKWKSPYLVLISCLLSLRTQDSTTLKASERLFALARTPERMVQLTVAEIEKAIFPVGFYKTKARRLIAISQDLLTRFKGRVPETLDELLTLNGVGRKTANLVLVEGFGQYGVCVDTHVHRISNRLGYVRSRNPHETEEQLRAKLPQKYWKTYNALLVVWGQNICRPISPKCSVCAVRDICERHGVTDHR